MRASSRHTARVLLTPMSNHTLPGSALLPLPTEIASLVTSLHQRSRIFREHFEHAPKRGSSSTFAYLLPLLRTAMAHGYRDEGRLRQLAQHWCDRWRARGHQFEEAMYDRVLTTAYADLRKKEILPLPEYLQKRRSRHVNNVSST